MMSPHAMQRERWSFLASLERPSTRTKDPVIEAYEAAEKARIAKLEERYRLNPIDTSRKTYLALRDG